MDENLDEDTVAGFGHEWSTFRYERDTQELRDVFASYFSVFDWTALPPDATGFDAGCGTGRWARLVAPRVGHLHCIDASPEALAVARENLGGSKNCSFHHASVEHAPLDDESMDFGYSLGVLHHVPAPEEALRACVRKLKRGAPFLLYLYYALDNRPAPFRALWRVSNELRRRISRLPHPARLAASQAIAGIAYWPLARVARLVEVLGGDPGGIPLAAYRRRSFYVMRTDALDRFGTRLERRFTRAEMHQLMLDAGLVRIRFSEQVPFWTAVGHRA